MRIADLTQEDVAALIRDNRDDPEFRRALVDAYDENPDLFAFQRTSRDAPMSFREFIPEAFGVIESKDRYVHGWHIDAIADHLVAVTDLEIRKLVINIPPRWMKSLIVAVMWPAWVWTFDPTFRWLFSAYQATLSTRDNKKTRELVNSTWYRERFGDVCEIKAGRSLQTYFETTAGGFRQATSVGGAGTGFGGDAVVSDDPHNVMQTESDVKRQYVLDWWDSQMSTRVHNPNTGVHVVVMQRIHESDLAGHLIESGDYEALIIPEKYEADETRGTSIGWSDPRSREGELGWPQQFSAEAVEAQNRILGPYQTAGQKQQRPAPKGGQFIKSAWWRWFDVYPADLDRLVQSWDMAFADPGDSRAPGELSFVVGQIWGQRGPDFFLLDQYRERVDFVETCAAVEAMIAKWPEARTKWIEDKANGPAVVATLKRKYSGIEAVPPEGSKLARFHATVVPLAASGNVYLPSPKIAPWVSLYVKELETFPTSTNDDQVDASSQALLWMTRKRPLYVRVGRS